MWSTQHLIDKSEITYFPCVFIILSNLSAVPMMTRTPEAFYDNDVICFLYSQDRVERSAPVGGHREHSLAVRSPDPPVGGTESEKLFIPRCQQKLQAGVLQAWTDHWVEHLEAQGTPRRGAVESNFSVYCILWKSSQGQQTAGQMLCLEMAAKLQATVVWHLWKKPR